MTKTGAPAPEECVDAEQLGQLIVRRRSVTGATTEATAQTKCWMPWMFWISSSRCGAARARDGEEGVQVAPVEHAGILHTCRLRCGVNGLVRHLPSARAGVFPERTTHGGIAHLLETGPNWRPPTGRSETGSEWTSSNISRRPKGQADRRCLTLRAQGWAVT